MELHTYASSEQYWVFSLKVREGTVLTEVRHAVKEVGRREHLLSNQGYRGYRGGKTELELTELQVSLTQTSNPALDLKGVGLIWCL